MPGPSTVVGRILGAVGGEPLRGTRSDDFLAPSCTTLAAAAVFVSKANTPVFDGGGTPMTTAGTHRHTGGVCRPSSRTEHPATTLSPTRRDPMKTAADRRSDVCRGTVAETLGRQSQALTEAREQGLGAQL